MALPPAEWQAEIPLLIFGNLLLISFPLSDSPAKNARVLVETHPFPEEFVPQEMKGSHMSDILTCPDLGKEASIPLHGRGKGPKGQTIDIPPASHFTNSTRNKGLCL
jgi:hypothetical protein